MKSIRRWIAILLLLLAIISFLPSCSGGGSGGNGEEANPAENYRLTINAANGQVTVQPDSASYASGTRVTLTATGNAGYDFDSWSSDGSGRENPYVIVMDGDKNIDALFTNYTTITYYVDFADGNDGNSGLSRASAWKHAPGDIQATDNAQTTQPGPGVTVLLKGDVVYRGNISIPADGSANHPVIYRGDAWPGLEGVKAIIDGGDPVTGWTPCASAAECNGNPNFANLFYAFLPGNVDPLSLNLHEYNASTSEDEFLWLAQDPNPANAYFYDDRTDFISLPQIDLTRTSITAPAYFDQSDPDYWNDSYLLVWVNPNIVVTRKITGFDPASGSVMFDDLGANAIYPDGRDQSYALYNSPHAIDHAGEYFISTTPDNQNRLKILLWPRSNTDLDARVTRSVRTYGIDINSRSNIVIEGFVVRKYSGAGLRDGVGIGDVTGAYLANYNLIVKDNLITHNRKGGSDRGYGGIFLENCYNTVIEENAVIENPRHKGIFVGTGNGITVMNNTIIRSGSTSLCFYSVDDGIVQGNTIQEGNGSHANGITLYLGCNNILVANNRLYDNASPVTFQDSGNLYFINNIIDGSDRENNVNEWGDTSNGPWERGIIAFFNNTIVRNSRNASLNIGDNPGLNTYIAVNNIVDGGLSGSAIIRSNNIYTGLSWSQSGSYGWYLGEGELVQEDLGLLFIDPAGPDFRITASSPARGAGVDITPYFPAQLFPSFDFRKDIDGKIRTVWDIGAQAY